MAENYKYPESFLEEVITKNDIVDVVSTYVKIDRKGKDYFGLCPFHSEKTPSFSVVPAKQIYYCFGCNKGGNVINFVKDIENLEYGEAIRHLAERANINIPIKNSYVDQALLLREKRIYEMNAIAARFFFENMKAQENNLAYKYLRERGVKSETIAAFGMGFAKKDWASLYEHLKSKGFSDKEILDGGLISKSKKDSLYDRFRNRIIFPIIDIRNRVIGFGGRALDEKDVKYINSPETLVYKKNRSLFGLNFAKHSKHDYAIIVEGYLDCIMLNQEGFSNTIATLGTALTENQALMIKRLFGQVVIAYDNDAAGQNATLRGLDILAATGCVVKVLILPKKDDYNNVIKDPDDFIKYKGAKAFKELLEEAMLLVEYKAFLLKEKHDTNTSEGLIAFLKGVAKAIGQVDSPVERDVYIKNISARFNTSYEALLKEVQEVGGKEPRPKTQIQVSKYEKKVLPSLRDAKTTIDLTTIFYGILVILCNKPSFADQIKEDLLNEKIFHSDYAKDLLEEILLKIEEQENPDEAKVASMLDDEQRAIFIKQAANYHTISDSQKALHDYIRKYRHDIIANNNLILVKALESEGLSEEERRNLEQEFRKNTELLVKYK